MADLFPCPECEHWNPIGRETCFLCGHDLTGVDPRKLLRASRRTTAAWMGPLLGGLIVVGLAAFGWWYFQRQAVQSDTTAPRLTLTTEQDLVVSDEMIEVAGRVDDEHAERVLAGGIDAPVVDGAFSVRVPVSNSTTEISVIAFDANGNQSPEQVIRIRVDREPPALDKLEPEDGSTVLTSSARVAGTASEELASVTVNGQPGEVDGASFNAVVELTEGENEIELSLADRAGNTTERRLTVTYTERRLPPGLSASGRTATGHELFTAAKDESELVLVPAGTFRMGSSDGDADERPPHEVSVSAFFIDRRPVTNAQYAAFMEATGRRQPPAPSFDSNHFRGSPDHPVVMVSWQDAVAYAEWAGRELPSEAQWELAARGTDSSVYPWGDSPPTATQCNFRGTDDGYEDTSPVGTFPDGASDYGIDDMAGNAWEWSADRYSADYYGSSPSQDPTGPRSGSRRTVRGGAHNSSADDVRSANRWSFPPSGRRENIGFRTVARFPE